MKDLQPLPDCMAPDGADPCPGYHAALQRIKALEAEHERLLKALTPATET